MKIVCPNCGAILEDGSMFCNKCGTKIDFASIAEPEYDTAPLEAYTPQYTPEESAPIEAYAPESTIPAEVHATADTVNKTQVDAIQTTTETSQTKSKQKAKKKTGLIIGIIGAVVLVPLILFIVLIIALSGGDDDKPEDTTTPSTEFVQTVTQMSDNKYDFNFSLNNVVYKLPATINDFENDGWIIADNDKSATLQPQESIDVSAQNDTGYITLRFYNDSDTAKSVKDCQVGGVTLSFNRSNTYTVTLSNELALADGSALTDVLFLWGEYNYVERLQYFYQEAQTIANSCAYIFETDIDGNLVSVSINNYDKDNTYSNGTIIDGISAEIAAPVDALSDNLADGIVSFDGIPYALPARVGDLTGPGDWQLVIGATRIAPNEMTYIVLTKNLRTFGFDNLVTLHIINTTDEEISFEDATIIGISYDSSYETTIPILAFANDITLGMTEEDFLSAANNFELTTETSGDSIYYRSALVDNGFEYTFVFREDKTLESMDIMYQYTVE